jgi:hypothetical protein
MLEGWKVHVNVMRHNGRGPRGGGGITTLGAWRTISEDANCLPQLSLFNKASTYASSVWHLLASTPLGCKFEAIDFKIDFIFFFHACDRLHPDQVTRSSLWLRFFLWKKVGTRNHGFDDIPRCHKSEKDHYKFLKLQQIE